MNRIEVIAGARDEWIDRFRNHLSVTERDTSLAEFIDHRIRRYEDARVGRAIAAWQQHACQFQENGRWRCWTDGEEFDVGEVTSHQMSAVLAVFRGDAGGDSDG